MRTTMDAEVTLGLASRRRSFVRARRCGVKFETFLFVAFLVSTSLAFATGAGENVVALACLAGEALSVNPGCSLPDAQEMLEPASVMAAQLPAPGGMVARIA